MDRVHVKPEIHQFHAGLHFVNYATENFVQMFARKLVIKAVKIELMNCLSCEKLSQRFSCDWSWKLELFVWAIEICVDPDTSHVNSAKISIVLVLNRSICLILRFFFSSFGCLPS